MSFHCGAQLIQKFQSQTEHNYSISSCLGRLFPVTTRHSQNVCIRKKFSLFYALLQNGFRCSQQNLIFKGLPFLEGTIRFSHLIKFNLFLWLVPEQPCNAGRTLQKVPELTEEDQSSYFPFLLSFGDQFMLHKRQLLQKHCSCLLQLFCVFA